MKSPFAHFCPSSLIHSGCSARANRRTSSLRLSEAEPLYVYTATLVGW